MHTNTKKNEIRVGTSGYSYEDWRAHFYPEELDKSSMLDYYSTQFNVVEINATYYKILSADIFKRMAEKTPLNFEFIVKLHQESTHRRRENEGAVKQLAGAVKPLIEARKFSGFLAQYPFSFKNSQKNRKYLADTKKLIPDYKLFAEFRHSSWNKSPLIPFLKENKIGYVNVDQPQLPGLLPPQDWVTNNCGYIRFHGRNEKMWWDGKGSERYDYEYSEETLTDWLSQISSVLKKTYKTYIFFNNHPNGQAVRNAKTMIQLLADL